MNNTNPEYHIDVTPEEDSLFRDLPEKSTERKFKFNNNLFKNKIFWIVLVVHASILTVLTVSAKPTEKNTASTETLTEDQKYLSQPIPEAPLASSTPTPVPVSNAPQTDVPIDRVPPKITTTKSPPQSHFTKDYTIKTGDTIFSVARKYKLNYDRLIKINNIKDPNKIRVGQKLKFM